MTQTKSANLEGKVEDIGAIHFLRAEWRSATSPFALIRYSINGEEKDLGLRLDLDKRAILDPLDDAGTHVTHDGMKDRIEAISRIVAEAKGAPAPQP